MKTSIPKWRECGSAVRIRRRFQRDIVFAHPYKPHALSHMFDKQARFRVGEFDGEKERATDNEVSAITLHRIFVCGLGVGEGIVCCLRF